MMQNNLIDFGFASYESSLPNIIHRHIYDQSFCVVSYTDLSDQGSTISPRILDPGKEVQLSGGNFSSLTLWREKWFSGHSSCRIEINSPHMMANLLKEEGAWALLSSVSAERMAELYGIRIYSLSDPPEKRKIYLLRHEGLAAMQTEAASLFSNMLAHATAR